MQLFCFTYAGGTAAFYDQLDEFISAEIEIVKYDYPGHGSRRKEPFCSDFDEIADDFYNKIVREIHIEEPYGLFGYSMGTITLVEVLRRIMEDGTIPYPSSVFLAAHEPYSRDELKEYTEDELDDYVKQRTLKFGGIPEKLIDNTSFWRTYLPIFRSDYSIIGKYDFNRLNLRASIPLAVFYSEKDTPIEKMKKWEKFFVGDVEFRQYDGNHFFISGCCKEICDIIYQKLCFYGRKKQ